LSCKQRTKFLLALADRSVIALKPFVRCLINGRKSVSFSSVSTTIVLNSGFVGQRLSVRSTFSRNDLHVLANERSDCTHGRKHDARLRDSHFEIS